MLHKIVCLFVLVVATLINVALSKCGYITDCRLYDNSVIPGNDNLTYICGEHQYPDFVNDEEYVKCSNYRFRFEVIYPGTVNFENCRFPRVKTNYFQRFPNMHTFIISNVELEEITVSIFQEAKKVTNLIVSHNRLSEIPSLAFLNAKKLKQADFSNNTIQKIDPMAFVGVTSLQSLDLSQNKISTFHKQFFKFTPSLEMLNLSYNEINEFDSETVIAPKLIALDLSNNNLAVLKEKAFDKFSDLK